MNRDELLNLIRQAARQGESELAFFFQEWTELPPEIGQLTTLRDLRIARSALRKLPPEIGRLTKLRVLRLRGNCLTALPPEISGLTALRALHLDGNELTTLPSEIGDLTELLIIDLDGNQLRFLPPEVGKLSALIELHLRNNQLTTLPPEICELTVLRELYLEGNPLTTLPLEIMRLTSLERIGLDETQLQNLPPEIVRWSQGLSTRRKTREKENLILDESTTSTHSDTRRNQVHDSSYGSDSVKGKIERLEKHQQSDSNASLSAGSGPDGDCRDNQVLLPRNTKLRGEVEKPEPDIHSSRISSAPSNLRFDAAVPEQVIWQRAFDVAAAIRLQDSPVLREDELTDSKSKSFRFAWPLFSHSVPLCITVIAPECEVVGPDRHRFRLIRGKDSPVIYFHLIPQQLGQLTITMILYREDDTLGATRVPVRVVDEIIAVTNRFTITSAPVKVTRHRRIKRRGNIFVTNVYGGQVGVISDDADVEGGIHS